MSARSNLDEVSFAGTFVFIGFAYPMRKLLIFRMPKASRERSDVRH